MESFRYKAFISYSHRDRKWSAWLQRALESYRVPKRLVGVDGEFGPVPQRLQPVFRDREDLPSASDLSAKVKEALEASEAMIVICSPAAMKSVWVNEEVQFFRGLGRQSRIFALIVDGDPQAKDPAGQCFPAALVKSPDGTEHEPLAADARKWADGKLLAKLKIVSGILGIRLDDLRRRNLQRQRRNRLITAASAVAVLLITGTLTYTMLTSQKQARQQRASTEELLGYMLGNLTRLDPIVGLEVIDQEDEQIKQYVRILGFDAMTDDQLIEKGMEWREQGQDDHYRGNTGEATEQFKRSRAAFVELHQREGSTTRALYELGQAEFWVGYVFYDNGELDEAEERFTRYGAIARRLVNADPNNAEMVMELSYTLGNLGALEGARANPDKDKSLSLFKSALQYNQIALVLDPENDAYRQAQARSLAFLADGWLASCDLGKALTFRQQNVASARALFEENPGDQGLKDEYASALSGLAAVQRRIPISQRAMANLQESSDLFRQLARSDDDNPWLHWRALMRKHRLFQIRTWAEPGEGLWLEAQALKQELDALYQANETGNYDKSVDYAATLFDYSHFAWREGRIKEAEQALREATDRLFALVSEKPENGIARQALGAALLDHWDRYKTLPNEEAVAFLNGYLVGRTGAWSCNEASLGAKLELMRGNISEATVYTSYLLGKGYFEPGFVAFCKKYDLCEQ